jgi:hypothetical protein
LSFARDVRREVRKMASTLNDVRAINTAATADQSEASEGMHLARFCTLEEALILIFGVMTAAFIVLSLFAIKP